MVPQSESVRGHRAQYNSGAGRRYWSAAHGYDYCLALGHSLILFCREEVTVLRDRSQEVDGHIVVADLFIPAA
jgi:hypothetical protein